MFKVSDMLDNRIITYISLSLAFFYLLIGFNQGIGIYDEGLTVYGAMRVLNGDQPYRDFWSLYAPAQFYLLAGLFKLFGASIIVERISSIMIMFILSAIVYFITRRLVSQKVALITLFIMVTWLDSLKMFASPTLPALLFSLSSSLCLLNFLFQKRRLWLILSGLLVGVATLFRHDFGFYTFLSEMLVVISFVLIAPREMSPANRILGAIRAGFYYLLGMVFILLPGLIFLVSVVPLDELIYDLVIFPITIYPKVRFLPYPAPFPNPAHIFTGDLSPLSYAKSTLYRIPFYFPFLMYMLGIIMLMIKMCKSKDRWAKIEVWGIILFILLGIMFFNQARVRSDIWHLLPTFIPAVILFSILLHDIPKTMKNGRFTHWFLVLMMLAAISVVSKPILQKVRSASSFFSSPTFSFDLERARGINWDQKGIPYQKAIEYVQRNVPEGERIFVGNVRHDRIVINDIMFYFLSNRHSSTKYNELHPGLATTATVQEEIVNDIEMHQVRYIVLRDDENVQEPNESGRSSGVNILDNFIREKFKLVQQFGNYAIWKRKTH